MNDRLTDEAWQVMLKGANPPAPPQWTAAFIDHDQNFAITQVHHALLELETVNDVNVQINPASPTVGSTIALKVEAYRYDSPLAAIFYDQNGIEIDSLNLIWESAAAIRGNYTGNIATSAWSGGTIMVKILCTGNTLATHWFELVKTSGINGKGSSPSIFSLAQNYPNPFNPITTIEFNLPKDGLMSLRIYDLRGRLIQTLLERNLNAGHYFYQWDASNLPSSIYLITLSSGGHTITRKTVLVK